MKKPRDFLLAKCVEQAVFQSLLNAMNADCPEAAKRWEQHADKLERKYITEYEEHYDATIARGAP